MIFKTRKEAENYSHSALLTEYDMSEDQYIKSGRNTKYLLPIFKHETQERYAVIDNIDTIKSLIEKKWFEKNENIFVNKKMV